MFETVSRAIVALTADFKDFKRRFDVALSLYRQNKRSSSLIISGTGFSEQSESYVYEMFKKFDIPLYHIRLELLSNSTMENALYSKHIIDKLRARKVCVVGDSSQMARIKKYFGKTFGRDYELEFYPAPIGLKAFQDLPFEIFKYMLSLLPDRINRNISIRLKRLKDGKTLT